MNSGPTGTTTSAGEDIDLYCLHCGYNLRGLSGDLRRCPECGQLNPVGLITIPAAEISRQLRMMETAPATCVGTIVIGGPFFLFGCALLAMSVADSLSSRFFRPFLLVWALVLTTVPLILIVFNLRRFRMSCQAKEGWPWALFKYHAYAFLCVGIVLAPFLLGALSRPWPRTLLPGLPDVVWIAGLFALIPLYVFGTRKLVWWAYRKAKEDMEHLQREVAVTMARERLRREFARPR